jgi:hypothetical protein
MAVCSGRGGIDSMDRAATIYATSIDACLGRLASDQHGIVDAVRPAAPEGHVAPGHAAMAWQVRVPPTASCVTPMRCRRVPARATLSSPLTPPPPPCRVVSASHAALAFGQGVYWLAASPESRVAFSRPFAFLPANALIEAIGVAYFLYDVLAMLAFARHVSRAFFRGIMVHHAIFIAAYASTLVCHSHVANFPPQHDRPQCSRHLCVRIRTTVAPQRPHSICPAATSAQ